MSLAKTQPLRFSPAGLCDSLDETDTNPGGCAVLQNLIPDPSTQNIWTCRPASLLATAFAGFTTPGVISVFKIVGSYVYGLVASGATAGYDQPFVYNLAASAFVALTGVTSSNVPATQGTTGEWTPPTMDIVGTYVVVTHPGFSGVTDYIGWFNISNPAAPVWAAGNLTSGTHISFTVVPAWVCQFNGRAFYGINPPTGQPSVIMSDSLNPLNCSNAGQALTFYDNKPLTAGVGLPLNNQLGGIIQALLVFKGNSNIYQVTGDYAASSIAINTLNSAVGTLAPRSIAATPVGVAFLAADGIRIIDFNGAVSDPIGSGGAGVVVPFLTPVAYSRVSAACNAQVYRISVQNSRVAGTPYQEYWYDIVRKVWSGPHTLPAGMIGVYGSEFVVAPVGVPAQLFLSKVVPDSTTSSTENGAPMLAVFQTTVVRDNEQMAMSEIAEMQVKTTSVASVAGIQVSALDENGSVLNTVFYAFAAVATLWGSFRWGDALWGGAQSGVYPRPISFNAPVVYNRLAVNVAFVCGNGFQIGDIFIRRRVLGYMQKEVG